MRALPSFGWSLRPVAIRIGEVRGWAFPQLQLGRRRRPELQLGRRVAELLPGRVEVLLGTFTLLLGAGTPLLLGASTPLLLGASAPLLLGAGAPLLLGAAFHLSFVLESRAARVLESLQVLHTARLLLGGSPFHAPLVQRPFFQGPGFERRFHHERGSRPRLLDLEGGTACGAGSIAEPRAGHPFHVLRSLAIRPAGGGY